ncbi:MAG TPA: hypothetical protein VFA05_02325 [Gaiellaceae bacterium]|nr:hypothetical protein [Gaiellaceae bacterium]
MRAPGPLEVYVGPMFSGKTDALIDGYARARERGLSVVAYKAAADTRDGRDRIVSHSGRAIPAQAVGSAAEVVAGPAPAAVFVDEVQFFGEEIADVVRTLRAAGTEVTAAGLDYDFRRVAFEATALLVADASRATVLSAVCARCGEPAPFTQRLVRGVPAPASAPRFVVGGAELYEPRCARCWVPSASRRRVRGRVERRAQAAQD